MVIHWLAVFFSWPAGAVWGNFVADAVAFVIGGRWLKSKLDKHHREKLAQSEAHHQIQMDKLETIHLHVKDRRNANHKL